MLARAMFLCLCAAGCAARESSVSVPVAALPAPQASATAPPPDVASTPPPRLPAGYVKMTVAGVIPEGQGASVALLDPVRDVVVEIHVGGSEATSITHRFERTAFQRPLTHDLMDSLMKETGVEIVRAQVDKLEGGTFFGALLVRQKNRYVELDARPSDAIALAMGSGAPIYCASAVIERAGVPRGEVDGLDAP